jgi:hypothetical protein
MMKTAARSGAEVQFVEIPLTPDAASVMRAVAWSRIRSYLLLFGLLAAVMLIGGALIAGLSGALLAAIPLGVLAVPPLAAAAWSIWSRARSDATHGTIIRATGRMTILAKASYPDSDPGVHAVSTTLIIQGIRLNVEYAAVASIWSHPGATKVIKYRDGLFSEKETWVFQGVVEYAPRSLIVLNIRIGDGLLMWQDPRFVPGAPPPTQPDIVGELEHRFLPILEATAEDLRVEFEWHDIRTSSHAVGSQTKLRGHAIAIDCLLPDPVSPNRTDDLRLEISARHVDTKPLLDNAKVAWNPPRGYLEIDLVPMPEPASTDRLDQLEAEVPQLVDVLRDALRRGSPPP